MGRKKGKKKKSSGKSKKKGGSGTASSGASFQFLLREYGTQNTSSQSFFDPFDSLSNSDLRNGFKHLGKKDVTTKIKALKTLIEGISKESVENVVGILPKFVKIFSRLCIDNSHKIREMSYILFTVIAEKCQNLLTPHLKDYMGPWVMGMHDLEREVRDSATRGFERIFPKQKRRIRALDFTMESLLQYFISNFNKTMDQLTPHKSAKIIEKKERYHRVLTSSILSLEYLIRTVPTSISKYELFQNLCGNQNFWLFLKVKNFPRIRSATFSLLSTICRDLKELIDDTYLPFLTPLVFNVFREKDAMVQKSCFEALIAYLKTFPQCWGFVKDVWKQIFPQLWRFLKHPEVSQTHFFNILLPFLSLINYDVLGGKNENSIRFFDSFFGNLWDGYQFVREVRKDAGSLVRVANAYFECLMFVVLQSNIYINIDEVEDAKEEEEEEGEEEEEEEQKEPRQERIRKMFFEPLVGKYLIGFFIQYFFFRSLQQAKDQQQQLQEGEISRNKKKELFVEEEDDDDEDDEEEGENKAGEIANIKIEDEVEVRNKVVGTLVMCLLRLTIHSGVSTSLKSDRKGGKCLFDMISRFWKSGFIDVLVHKPQQQQQEEEQSAAHYEDEDFETVKRRNTLILKFNQVLEEKSKARNDLHVYLQEEYLKNLFWSLFHRKVVEIDDKQPRRTDFLINHFEVLNHVVALYNPFLEDHEETITTSFLSFEKLVKLLVLEEQRVLQFRKRKRVSAKFLRLRQEVYSFICYVYHTQYMKISGDHQVVDEWVEDHFNPFFRIFLVEEKYGFHSPQTIIFFLNHLPHEMLLRAESAEKVKFLDWLMDDYVSSIIENNPVLFVIDEETVISSTQRKNIKKKHLDDLGKIMEFYHHHRSKDSPNNETFAKNIMGWVRNSRLLSLKEIMAHSVDQKFFTYSFFQDYEDYSDSDSDHHDEDEDDMGRKYENEKIVFLEQMQLKLELMAFLNDKVIDFTKNNDEEFVTSLCTLFFLSHKFVSNYYTQPEDMYYAFEKTEKDAIFRSLEQINDKFWSKISSRHNCIRSLSAKFDEILIQPCVRELEDPKNEASKYLLKVMKMYTKRILNIADQISKEQEGVQKLDRKFEQCLFHVIKNMEEEKDNTNNNNNNKLTKNIWTIFRAKLTSKSEKTKKYKMFILYFMWYVRQRYILKNKALGTMFSSPSIQNEMFYIRHEITSSTPPSPVSGSVFISFEDDFGQFYERYFVKLYLLKDYTEQPRDISRWIQKVRRLLTVQILDDEGKIRVYRARSVLRFVLSEMLKMKDFVGIYELYLALSHLFIFDNDDPKQKISESWVQDRKSSEDGRPGRSGRTVLGWDLFSIVHDSFFYFWSKQHMNHGRRVRALILEHGTNNEEFKLVLEEQLLIVSSLFITSYSSHDDEKDPKKEEELKFMLKFVYVLLMAYSSVKRPQQQQQQSEQEEEEEEEEDGNVINVQNVLRIVLDTTSVSNLSTFQTIKYIFSFIIQFRCSSSSSSAFLFSKQEEGKGDNLVSEILKFLKDEVWGKNLKNLINCSSKEESEEEGVMKLSREDVQMTYYMMKLYSFILNELVESAKKEEKHNNKNNLTELISSCRTQIIEIFLSLSNSVVEYETIYLKKMMLMIDDPPLQNRIENEEEEESIILSTLYSRNNVYDDVHNEEEEEEEDKNQWFVVKYGILKLLGPALLKCYQHEKMYIIYKSETQEIAEKLEDNLLTILRKSKILELQKLSLALLKSTFEDSLLLYKGKDEEEEEDEVIDDLEEEEGESESEEEEEDIKKKMKKKKKEGEEVRIDKEIRLIESSTSESEGLSLFGYTFSWDYFVFIFEKLVSSRNRNQRLPKKLVEKKKVKILNFLKNNPSQTYVPFLNLIFFQFLLSSGSAAKGSSEGGEEESDGYSSSDDDEEDDSIKKEDREMLDRILFSFLLNFSTLFRSFAQDNVTNEELRKKIEKYVNVHFSSKIIQKELNSLSKIYAVKKKSKKSKKKNMWEYDSDEDEDGAKSRVEVYKSSRTIKIIYTQDEINLSVTIQVPSNYPFRPLKLLKSSKFGIQKDTWNKWILKLTFFLFNKNTSNIVHAVSLFLKNLDHYFKGSQECCICFSIINSLNYKIPDKKCKTCRKMFHGYCLFKWFSKSGKSTCPMCRQLF